MFEKKSEEAVRGECHHQSDFSDVGCIQIHDTPNREIFLTIGVAGFDRTTLKEVEALSGRAWRRKDRNRRETYLSRMETREFEGKQIPVRRARLSGPLNGLHPLGGGGLSLDE